MNMQQEMTDSVLVNCNCLLAHDHNYFETIFWGWSLIRADLIMDLNEYFNNLDGQEGL